MAEARSIAGFGNRLAGGRQVQLAYDDEGVHLNISATIPKPREALRRLARWTRSMYRAVHYSFFPFGPAIVAGSAAATSAIVVAAPRDSWIRSGKLASLVWELSKHFPWLPGTQLWLRVGTLAGWTAVGGLLTAAVLQRGLLKALLRDKTWLYMNRAPTLRVKAWALLVRALTRGRPLLYSFQSSLPPLPVPDLKDTVERYKSYARVLQSGEELAETEALAAHFLSNEGPRIQRYLKLKYWFSDNYVTDWWEKYVYLIGRDPIAINSNYYVLDSGRFTPTHVQEARAGTVLYQMMQYKEDLSNEVIEPTITASGAPLCMWQYERMFATSRLPGRDCDEVKHWDPTQVKHVAVYCKGSFYRLDVYRRDGSLRTPDELEASFVAIKADAAARQAAGATDEAEACIPGLTGWGRTEWATVRETHFAEGVNRRSLDTVESALLYVVLSDKTFEEGEPGWTPRGKYLIGADPAMPDIWFDKSVCLVVTANGKAGMNCEHSWADAPVAAHLFEVSMIVGESKLNPYTEAGHCRSYQVPPVGFFGRLLGRGGSACAGVPAPGAPLDAHAVTRLSWSLDRKAEASIFAAREALAALNVELDLRVAAFSDYGKDFVKTCRVSPDAYMQLAMQLAYWRDQGRLDNTYESSMTRLYLHGRTETVRPCTQQAKEFVGTMSDPAASPLDKLKALQKAAARHELGYKDAMTGKGIDRHLFALYIVSRGKNIESAFLKRALNVKWRLSTSQQPQQQTTLWDIKDPANATKISPGGGFGPVAADGYGVSYMVSGERELFFHVSSKTSCPTTDSGRFQGQIFQALREMRQIMTAGLLEDKQRKAAAAAAAAK